MDIGDALMSWLGVLEFVDVASPKTALMLGLHVWFVGTVEAKIEIAANVRGVPCSTLHGRRGGSAMATAAVNALAKEAEI